MGVVCQVFTIPEFMAYIGVRSRNTFYRWQRAGIGPRVIRMGGRRVILRETAETWLRGREDMLPPSMPSRNVAHSHLTGSACAPPNEDGPRGAGAD